MTSKFGNWQSTFDKWPDQVSDDSPSLAHKLLDTLGEAAYLLSLSKREVEELVQAGHLESGIAPGTKRGTADILEAAPSVRAEA